jgi:O-antigen/teichoic acid export membrane protein
VLVIVAVPVNALKIGVSYYLLSNGYGVLTVALVLVACFVTTFILEFLVLCRYMTWHGVSLDLGFCRALLGRAWRFFAINWLDALSSTVNTVLLSWFVGEVAVGIFSAAWQLLVPVTLALQAVHNSLFPTLCRRANSDRRQLQRLILLMLEVLAFIAVPGCVLMYFCAEPIISLIYGHRDFSGSIAIMRIILPVVILQAVSNTFSLVLYSHHREHITLRITATNLVFNVVFGIMLVKSFGLTGAAIAAVLTALLNVSLQLWSARGLLADGSDRKVSWGTSLLGQILAAGCTMACAMALLSRMNVIAASILTSCLYVMVLALLVTGACRRSLGIRERFLVPLKD